ncbi:hypothetical protein ACFLZP_00235 [Patescibacteria group bacterium]
MIISKLVVHAAEEGITNPLLPDDIRAMSPVSTLNRFLKVTISAILVGGVLGSFLFLIVGAYNWITSGGDKVKTQQAKLKVTHAIIGLMILVFLFAIIELIGYIFGVNLLEMAVPSVVSTE